MAMQGLMWQEYAGWSMVDERFYTINWPPQLPDLNLIEHFWDIMFRSIERRQVAPQTVKELNNVNADCACDKLKLNLNLNLNLES